MNLETANKRLAQIAYELPDAIKHLAQVEYKYQMNYFDSLIHSPASSQDRREAEAILKANTSDLYQPFLNAKVEVRSLQNEKECLVEISRNIRSLRGQE